MPCRCTGVRLKKCKCVLGTDFTLKRKGSDVILAGHSKSICCPQNKIPPKQSIFIRIVENFYETCAGYNLRYCPLRGFAKTDSCLSNTLKDLTVLLCFLVANFVVFMAIVFKIAVHAYFTFARSTHWLHKSLTAKSDSNSPHFLTTSPLKHNYAPPLPYKFY